MTVENMGILGKVSRWFEQRRIQGEERRKEEAEKHYSQLISRSGPRNVSDDEMRSRRSEELKDRDRSSYGARGRHYEHD